MPDTIEKEYEENLRLANQEIRKQHGYEVVNDQDNDTDKAKKPEPIPIQKDEMNGREAFFSLIAIKMMKLSQKYNRKLEDLHSIFYMVSCDW